MRHGFPYMIGTYLAVNAIPDMCLVVDGPDCSFFKAEYIYGNHDLRSELLNAAGFGRIIYSGVTFHSIIMDRSEEIIRTVAESVHRGGFSVIMLTSMPMAKITDVQYDLVLSRGRFPDGTSVLLLPGNSLTHDWLGGFSQVLTTIAESIPGITRSGKYRRNNVAVVGHFMHRTEADERANVAELERILSALSLNLVSVWLGGGDFESLRNVRNADTIISLPCGRDAAHILAEKLKAELIEVDVPFGFQNTKRFVRTIAKHYDRAEPGETFIDAELRECAPALEWIIPRLFLHKNTFYSGAPHMLDGFLDLAGMTGMTVLGATISASEEFRKKNILWPARDLPDLFFEMPFEQWVKMEESISKQADVIVTDGSMLFSPDAPIVEFGFPSYFSHSLFPAPYIGFRGALSFMEKLAECLFRRLRVLEATSNKNVFHALGHEQK